MGNSLRELLTVLDEREEAGSISSDRFDYQKDWALLRLLSLHRQGESYVLLCEFHEDVTVLDDAENPKYVTFYQVKTDAKNPWTVKKLTKQKTSKAGNLLPSILGRLCGRATQLGDNQSAFQIVTNSGFSTKNGKTTTTVDVASDYVASDFLSESDWRELTLALKTELGVDLSSVLQGSLTFAVAELPLKMHAQAASGEVAKFLEDYAAGSLINPAAFYRALFDELRRMTVARKPDGANLSKICSAKGINRKKFDQMLTTAVRSAPHSFPFHKIDQELHHDGVALGRRAALRTASKSYYVRSLGSSDAALRADRRILVAAAENALADTPNLRLLELAEAALAVAEMESSYGVASLTEDEALALVMVELYERSDDEVPPPGLQPEEKGA